MLLLRRQTTLAAVAALVILACAAPAARAQLVTQIDGDIGIYSFLGIGLGTPGPVGNAVFLAAS